MHLHTAQYAKYMHSAAGVCFLSGPMVYPSAAVVKVNAGFKLPESETYVFASLYRMCTAIGEDTFLASLVVVQNHSEYTARSCCTASCHKRTVHRPPRCQCHFCQATSDGMA